MKRVPVLDVGPARVAGLFPPTEVVGGTNDGVCELGVGTFGTEVAGPGEEEGTFPVGGNIGLLGPASPTIQLVFLFRNIDKKNPLRQLRYVYDRM